jgi:uncharacterized membrane protein
MKRRGFSSKAFLVIGLVLFLLGLLLLMREATTVSVFSQVLPNSDAMEVFAVLMQLIGGVAVIFGVMKVASASFLINMRNETQELKSGFNQTMERLDRLITVQRASLMAAEARATVAAQTATLSISKPMVSSNCKFCGTRIESGRFCPKCGKAQS